MDDPGIRHRTRPAGVVLAAAIGLAVLAGCGGGTGVDPDGSAPGAGARAGEPESGGARVLVDAAASRDIDRLEAAIETRRDALDALAPWALPGASERIVEPMSEATALLAAARVGWTEGVLRLLAAGADPTVDAPEGTTALHLAARSMPDDRAVRALLEAGADVRRHNRWRGTPLHHAGWNEAGGSAANVAALLAAGADPGGQTIDGITPVYAAVEGGDAEALRRLVRADGADLDAINAQRGDAPLHRAVELGRCDLARILLDAGAWPLVTTTDRGRTALHVACTTSPPPPIECLGELVELGLEPNHPDGDGRTPLLLLAVTPVTDHAERLEALVDAGADPDREDIEGDTILIAVLQAGDPVTARVLVELGADPTRADADGVTAEAMARARAEAAGDAPAWTALLEAIEAGGPGG